MRECPNETTSEDMIAPGFEFVCKFRLDAEAHMTPNVKDVAKLVTSGVKGISYDITK